MILDWVPAHFPRDDFALARFDGTALYEHADPRRGAHPDWGTLVFNYGRHEVRNFLLANALYWLREYHADGMRVDAVASMLYLDYSREEGQWVPNQFGGKRGPRGRRLPEGARTRSSTAASRASISVAEESTAWPGVSRPDLPRRPRLRLQVEHGLDARHAGVLPAGPGLPPLAPPRADLQPRVRVHGELHPAALATTRSSHGKGSLLQQDARRQVAEARQPALPLRVHVGPSRQEAAVHGLRVRPGARSGARSARSTGTCSRTRSTRGCSPWCATSTTPTAPSRRCGSSTSTARASGGSRPTTPTRNVFAFAAPHARLRARGRLRRQPVADPARELPAGPAARGPLARGREHRLGLSTAARTSATSGGSRPARSGG